MLLPFNQIKTMGVINITPNSFSDVVSGTDLSSDRESLKKKISSFKQIPGLIYDFGFESTAPMNVAISKKVEKDRFDFFFESIKDFDLSNEWISFDTYNPENFVYFEERFRSRFHGCGFIFNDVSGVLDPEVLAVLEGHKNQDNFYYIYTSTHIPSRDQVQKHMHFQKQDNIFLSTGQFFINGLNQLLKTIPLEKIILDPGLGFSKSYDQNWELINHFDLLLSQLLKNGINCPWLVGLSKKSFLRRALPDSLDPFGDSEVLHAQVIKDFLKKYEAHFIFRAHDPFLVEKVYAGLQILE